MEESWPLLVAVSMVGGAGSTEHDSMMSRLGFGLHSFGPLALLIATVRGIYVLDNAFVLIDGTNFAGRVTWITSGTPLPAPGEFHHPN